MWTSVPQSDTTPSRPTVRFDGLGSLSRRQRSAFLCGLLLAFILLGYVAWSQDTHKSLNKPTNLGGGEEENLQIEDELVLDNALPTQSDLVGYREQKYEKPVGAKTQEFLDAVPRNCPNWSDEQVMLFQTKCAAWADWYVEWLEAEKYGKSPMTYSCIHDESCHGLGDRLAGWQGVFTAALESNRPFRVNWEGTGKLFHSCVFGDSKMAAWSEPISKIGCHTGSSGCSVYAEFGKRCKSNLVAAFEGVDRACLPQNICTKIQEYTPGAMDASNIYGCTLRALLEPTPSFLETKIPLHNGAQGVQLMTLGEAQELMSKYYVIAIHFRLGDAEAFYHPTTRTSSTAHPYFLYPFMCASTVQSYVEGRPIDESGMKVVHGEEIGWVADGSDKEYTVNGKPVRWFLASDSNNMRETAIDLYGDKLFMIDLRPQHIAFAAKSRHSSALSDTFAEWYLLGRGDALVTNRIGFKTWSLYKGRLSSFSKTAWVANMKSIFYDAGTCRRKQMLMDGTWHIAPNDCYKSPAMHGTMPQPHMANIAHFSNISFPTGYMDRGQVHVMDKKLLVPLGPSGGDGAGGDASPLDQDAADEEDELEKHDDDANQ